MSKNPKHRAPTEAETVKRRETWGESIEPFVDRRVKGKHAWGWRSDRIKEDQAGFTSENPKHRVKTVHVQEIIQAARERRDMIAIPQSFGPISSRSHVSAPRSAEL
jgi:hypothetical protein